MSTSSNSTQEIRLDDPDTNNATYIGWSNFDGGTYWPADYLIPEKRAYYRRLDRHNSGLQNGRWQNKRYETFGLAREEIFSLGSQLRMDAWQQKRASRLLTGEMRSELGLETTLVVLSLCGYVLHDSQSGRKCHPQTKEEDFDEDIDQILEELNIRRSDYEKTYRKIQRIDKREEQARTEVRDKYEMDMNSKQTWREVNANKGDGWL